MDLLASITLSIWGTVGQTTNEDTGDIVGGVLVLLVIIAALVLYGVTSSRREEERKRQEQERKRRADVRREANDRRRPSSTAWRRARARALRRDGYRCVQCRRPAEEVDHIVPRAMGGSVYALGNLQSMCKQCHKRKTARQAGQIRRYMRGE